jgi:hypothetical protein
MGGRSIWAACQLQGVEDAVLEFKNLQVWLHHSGPDVELCGRARPLQMHARRMPQPAARSGHAQLSPLRVRPPGPVLPRQRHHQPPRSAQAAGWGTEADGALPCHRSDVHAPRDNPAHAAPLQGLPKLQKLTLHGNPIAEQAKYKLWVLAHLGPGIRNFDFGSVTKVRARDAARVDSINPCARMQLADACLAPFYSNIMPAGGAREGRPLHAHVHEEEVSECESSGTCPWISSSALAHDTEFKGGSALRATHWKM